MTPSKSEHPLHETSTKPVATGGIPMVEKLRAQAVIVSRASKIIADAKAGDYEWARPEQTLEAAAAHLIEQLVEALDWYAEQFCEFGKSNEGCGKFSTDVCAGCKARTALSAARGESGK